MQSYKRKIRISRGQSAGSSSAFNRSYIRERMIYCYDRFSSSSLGSIKVLVEPLHSIESTRATPALLLTINLNIDTSTSLPHNINITNDMFLYIESV